MLWGSRRRFSRSRFRPMGILARFRVLLWLLLRAPSRSAVTSVRYGASREID